LAGGLPRTILAVAVYGARPQADLGREEMAKALRRRVRGALAAILPQPRGALGSARLIPRRFSMRLIAVALLAGTSLALTACGGSAGESDEPAAVATEAAAAAVASPLPSESASPSPSPSASATPTPTPSASASAA